MNTLTQPTTTSQDQKWSGISGLLATAAFVMTAVLTSLVGGVESPDDVADVARYLHDLSDVEVGYILYGAAGLALCALYVPMCIGVRRLLGDTVEARFGTLAVVAGLAILVPAYVLAGGTATALLNAGHGGAGDEALLAIHEFATATGTIFFAAGSVLSLGFGPLLWGLAARRSGLPRWVSRLAIVVGVAGLVWAVPPSEQIVIFVVVMVNVLGSLVLFTALSLRLLRHR